jgi:DNA-binding HxlR family transcriptional regulator
MTSPSERAAKAVYTIYIGKCLTRTLRNLESAGLITRCVSRSRSLAVEYSLTPLGRTFMRPLTNICSWADRYHKELTATVRLLDVKKQ